MIKKVKHLPKSFKIGLFILVLISGAYVSSRAFGYGQNNNSDGLVLDMTLSSENYNVGTKTFSDHSGNNNHGVSLNNAVFVPDKDGKSEGAMRFDGSSDQVIIDKSGIVNNPSELTIAAWFKKDGDGHTYECVLHQSSNYTISNSSFWLGLDSNDYFTATIGARTGVGWAAGQTNIKPVLGEWNHLLATWDGSMVRVYLNGEYVKEYALSTYSTLNTPVRIGASSATYYHFNGTVKNALIYDRYFSAAEVKKLYGDSKPKIQASSLEKGLVGYWPLDGENYNSNTNRVTDKSAYSNHGTNYGATLTADRFGRSEGAMGFNLAGERIGTTFKSNSHFTNSSNFTISSWIKIRTYPIDVFSRTGIIGCNQWNGGGFGLVINQNGVRMIAADFDGTTEISSPLSNFPLNTWHHLTFSYNNGVMTMYKNGVVVAQGNRPSWSVNNLDFLIGFGTQGGWNRTFQGDISETRIYNRALSQDEIKSLYERDAPKISASSLQKGLVLDMPLTSQYTKGGAAGSEIMVDNSPYSHNGQNYGGVVSGEGIFLSNTGNRVVTNLQVPNDQGTISVWYKPIHGTSDASRNSILYSTGASWIDNSFELALRACCGSPYDNVLYMRDSSSSYLRFEWDAPVWNANEWVHILVTYSSKGFIRPYVNGELQVASQALNNGVFNFPDMFVIGGKSSSSVSAKGTVRNMKVYDRVLSLDEIKSLYDQGRSQTGVILGGN